MPAESRGRSQVEDAVGALSDGRVLEERMPGGACSRSLGERGVRPRHPEPARRSVASRDALPRRRSERCRDVDRKPRAAFFPRRLRARLPRGHTTKRALRRLLSAWPVCSARSLWLTGARNASPTGAVLANQRGPERGARSTNMAVDMDTSSMTDRFQRCTEPPFSPRPGRCVRVPASCPASTPEKTLWAPPGRAPLATNDRCQTEHGWSG